MKSPLGDCVFDFQISVPRDYPNSLNRCVALNDKTWSAMENDHLVTVRAG